MLFCETHYREFGRAKDRFENRIAFMRKREKQKQCDDIEGYMKWLTTAGISNLLPILEML